MSLASYWPTTKNIAECIQTEAEELNESVLLAVHEQMNLVKSIGNGKSAQQHDVNENDLLLEVLKTERPIPIIAGSGMGKSHLIRWLHAKLKVHKTVIEENWHMVRIPKNSSLRQVLAILLDNLEGDIFEQARHRIDEVGSSLKEYELADLFVLFMAHRIIDIANDTKKKQKDYAVEQQAKGVDKHTIKASEQFKKLNEMVSFSKQLPNLVSDLAFKKQLLKPGSSVHQIATRWTKGASDEEIGENAYQLTETEFKQILNSLEVDDLSLPARDVIANLRLDSDTSQMEKAVRVINEALSKASQTAFQQLFQFNSGNFQDLFKDIRKHLKQQNRTLLILVEDLAAISAIEDVLLDSLMEERLDDLCILRSVIAVTSGHALHSRKLETIRTRVNGEWNINEKDSDENNERERIISFCARYLNAARYGQDSLTNLIDGSEEDFKLEPFNAGLLANEEQLQLEAFGVSHENIPLFPFNRNCINTLIDWYCLDLKKEVFFNPRAVLHNILLGVLQKHEIDFRCGVFPTKVTLLYKLNALEGEILRLGLDNEQQQAIVISNLWADADSLMGVKETLSTHIANAFNSPKFANKLVDVIADLPVKPNAPSSERNKVNRGSTAQKSNLEKEVDLWTNHDTPLSAKTANKLRSKLFDMICDYSKPEFMGFNKGNLFGKNGNLSVYQHVFKSGQRFSFELPFVLGNPQIIVSKFCDEATFFKKENDSHFFQRAALAILRYDEKGSWDYQGGVEDYIYYQRFIERWVPAQIKLMRAKVINELPSAIAKQKRIAVGLGVTLPNKASELLPVLLQSRAHLQGQLAPPINDAYSLFRDQLLDEWDNQKALWLSQISTFNNAVDFYEFGVANKVAKKITSELLTSAQNTLRKGVIKSIQPELSLIQEMLSDCTIQEDFESALETMKSIYRRIAEAHFLPNDSVARQTFNSYVKTVQDTVKLEQVKNSIKLTTETDEIKQLQLLSKVDGVMLKDTYKLLESWKKMSSFSMKKLESANERTSAHQVEALNNKIELALSEYESVVINAQSGEK